ncbi:hypothetical protein BC829DRAFT_401935 [Chytridium lagenaria]|nr:hypothetical protein BC829DRAFT_401935 [Chytridium lagenaria]
MNKENVKQQWHPECYMIYKLWNVRLGRILDSESAFEGDGNTVTKVDQILSTLSAFEESSADCISDMLLHLSNGSAIDGVNEAKKFIDHVTALFSGLDFIDRTSVFHGIKISSRRHREAKQLARSITYLLTVLSEIGAHTYRDGAKDMVSAVTAIAQSLKSAIKSGLNGAFLLERQLKKGDFVTKSSDCVLCRTAIEDECIQLESYLWHHHCYRCTVCNMGLAKSVLSKNVFCEIHRLEDSVSGSVEISKYQQYSWLLCRSYSKLCKSFELREAPAVAHIEKLHEKDEKDHKTYISEYQALDRLYIRTKVIQEIKRIFAAENIDIDYSSLTAAPKKGKLSVWTRMTEVLGVSKKGKLKGGIFGMPLEKVLVENGVLTELIHGRSPVRAPVVVDTCIRSLRQKDLSVEGIFRKNGNIRRLKELAELFDHCNEVSLDTETPIQIAALLKKFFREQPEPLMTFELYAFFTACEVFNIHYPSFHSPP